VYTLQDFKSSTVHEYDNALVAANSSSLTSKVLSVPFCSCTILGLFISKPKVRYFLPNSTASVSQRSLNL